MKQYESDFIHKIIPALTHSIKDLSKTIQEHSEATNKLCELLTDMKAASNK